MKILVLARLELRLAWNNFKLRVKSPPNIFLYILILASCMGINFILYVFLNLSPKEDRLQALSSLGLAGISPYLIIFTGFTILLATSVVKGLSSKLSTIGFKGPDLEILGSAPLKPHEVFMAKSLKVFIKRLLFAFIAEATFLTPIVGFFEMTVDRGIVLLSAILLYACFLYLVEAFAFFASRLAMNFVRVSKRTALLVIPIATFQAIFCEEFLNFVSWIAFLPTIAVSKVVYFSLFHAASLNIITFPLLSFLALFSGFSLIVMVLSALYYGGVETFEEAMKAGWLKFLGNRLKWSFGSRHSPLIAVFLKEFWTNLRTSHVPLIVVGYAILLSISLLNLGGGAFALGTLFTVSPSALAFAMLLFSFFFLPSLDVFLAEREKSWIVKVAPISMERVVLAKYLYSLIISLIALLPPFIGIASLAPLLAERLTLSVSSVPLLLLTNAIGIYISAHYTPESLREEFPVTGICAYMGLITVLASPIILIPLLFVSQPIALVLVSAFTLDYAIFLSYILLGEAAKTFFNRDDL